MEHKAPVSSVTDAGDSALQLATYSNKPHIIELLIQAGLLAVYQEFGLSYNLYCVVAGSDVNVANVKNETPLYTAIEHNASVQVRHYFFLSRLESESFLL